MILPLKKRRPHSSDKKGKGRCCKEHLTPSLQTILDRRHATRQYAADGRHSVRAVLRRPLPLSGRQDAALVDIVREVGIGVDVLHVVIVIQGFHEADDLLSGIGIHGHQILGNHGQLGGLHGHTGIFQRVTH